MSKFSAEKITVELLIQCGLAPTQAKQFVRPLQAACEYFSINSVNRFAALIGQCALESNNFTSLEENLYYTTPARIKEVYRRHMFSDVVAKSLVRNPQKLANRVYANEMGNGNEASGDGWKYRGRGLIQLTFLYNYKKAAKEITRPYVEQPELVGLAPDAALTAAHYWASHGCNEAADAWNIDATTKAMNPSMWGKTQRWLKCEAIKEILINH